LAKKIRDGDNICREGMPFGVDGEGMSFEVMEPCAVMRKVVSLWG